MSDSRCLTLTSLPAPAAASSWTSHLTSIRVPARPSVLARSISTPGAGPAGAALAPQGRAGAAPSIADHSTSSIYWGLHGGLPVKTISLRLPLPASLPPLAFAVPGAKRSDLSGLLVDSRRTSVGGVTRGPSDGPNLRGQELKLISQAPSQAKPGQAKAKPSQAKPKPSQARWPQRRLPPSGSG